jgi:hypothetical protein
MPSRQEHHWCQQSDWFAHADTVTARGVKEVKDERVDWNGARRQRQQCRNYRGKQQPGTE